MEKNLDFIAPLDADKGVLINGGTVVAIGGFGLCQTPASNSLQKYISFNSVKPIYGRISIVCNLETICDMENENGACSGLVSCEEFNWCEDYKLKIADLEIK